jgi:hypothetical protein
MSSSQWNVAFKNKTLGLNKIGPQMMSMKYNIYSPEKRVIICDMSAVRVMGANVTQNVFQRSRSSRVPSDRTMYKKAESSRIKGSVPENVNYQARILLEGGRINFSRWRR